LCQHRGAEGGRRSRVETEEGRERERSKLTSPLSTSFKTACCSSESCTPTSISGTESTARLLFDLVAAHLRWCIDDGEGREEEESGRKEREVKGVGSGRLG